uniref:Sensorin-1 n=1 Tax=Lymnaea stagnalis TaxID=6523 RepID=A0A1W5G3R0_LYMST|nr:sensorin-1 [Lymnaea stagnalis]ADK38659.1 sensorin-2 [Lymnaea stagnalis]
MSPTNMSSGLVPVLVLTVVACLMLTDNVSASARYRVGYMFGKRGIESPSTSFIDTISREMKTKQEVESLILKNPEILSEVLTILDKNDDGYITVSDVL